MKYYSSEVYAEVYELLSYMDKKEVMKIPIDLLEDIKNSRNKDYESKIDIFDLYNRDNLLPETLEVMAALGVMYLLPKEESEKIQKECELSIAKEQEKYKISDIFKNAKKQADLDETISIAEYKESTFMKFINKIKKYFKFKIKSK